MIGLFLFIAIVVILGLSYLLTKWFSRFIPKGDYKEFFMFVSFLVFAAIIGFGVLVLYVAGFGFSR